jgi:aminoglycoside phosphotransferase (APT) family kinase protein
MSDAARPPREGEALDAAALESCLRGLLPDLKTPLDILQFPAGHSNLTYLLRAGNLEMVLRRPPFGRKPKTGHDMRREWRILSALQEVFPYSPKPLAYCEDESILGAPFYVMERINGLLLRRDLPSEIHISPSRLRAMCEELIDVHKELHALDYRTLGLEGFGKPEGYVSRQISGWARRYREARTPDVPDFEDIIRWLESHQPPERGAAIIHNDYRFDNVVFHPKDFHIVGVLDWEMATIGDPWMDFGASLAYWIQGDDPLELQMLRLGPTHAPGALTRREVIERYAQGDIPGEDALLFYYVYGLFRLAGIAQQIYWRYVHGQTHDERFSRFGESVAILERAALRALDAGRVG